MVTVSTVVSLIALLIAVSATYNAYLLRGGKLAWSQVLIVLGMISLIFSMILSLVMGGVVVVGDITFDNIFFILGFVFLLAASVKIRHAFK